MRGHISTGFFRCDILFLQGKHSSFRDIVASAWTKFATYSKNSLYVHLFLLNCHILTLKYYW